MSKEIKALRKSIIVWLDIANGVPMPEEHRGETLCELYPPTCEGCPVFEHTQQRFCSSTPFELWDKVVTADTIRGVSVSYTTPYAKALANAQVELLKVILKERLKADLRRQAEEAVT